MTQRPSQTASASLTGPVLVAILAGVFVAVQGIFNGAFTSSGGGPLLASWVSYLGTLLTVVVIIAAQRNLGTFLRILRAQGKWWWFGVGMGGVPIVIAMAWGIPLVGVTISSVCAVAGQTIMSLLLDRVGVGVPARIPLSGRRIAAVCVVLAGVCLAIVAGGAGVSGFWAMVAVGLIVFFSGACIAIQNAGNGAVVAQSGYPLMATLTSVFGGTVIMTCIVAIVCLTGSLEGLTFPGFADWWMYLGGPAGTGIVFCGAWSVRRLGTFRLTLCMVAGQMVTAMIVDLASGVRVSPATVIASLAVIVATILVVDRSNPSGEKASSNGPAQEHPPVKEKAT